MSSKNKVRKAVANTKETGNFAKAFEILGSKTRLKILKIVANEEKCVNFLSKKLKISQPAVSYHLKLLLGLGLVKQHKRAQWVQYILNKEKLTELMANFSKLYGILKIQKRKERLLTNKS
ncbi:winged helix-turn-helix transcriptional regulator [Candidatus Aerophobetes bacterium]|nr:winged helix-turn-helix transcriptional regulator [Candidatus Aerophobetes bacterium]